MRSRNHSRNLIVLALALLPVLAGCAWLGGNPFAAGAAVAELRLWRVAMGALVGASLGVAGAVYQTALRNPLAEPLGLGVSAGSGLGVAAAIALGAGAVWWLQPLAGFAGALASIGIVDRLAHVRGRTSPHTLILAGVAWGALCASVLLYVATRSSADGMHALLWWFLGELQVYDERLVVAAGLLNTVAIGLLVLRGRRLDALLLGDEAAGHLGLAAERERWTALLLASWLAATAVCISGLIAFAGLIVPHAARGLCGTNHRRLLTASALLGAMFLALADGLGRLLAYPSELPVGLFTALAGAPFFLMLLRRRQREIWMSAP